MQVRKRSACEDPVPTLKKCRRSPACGEPTCVNGSLHITTSSNVALLSSQLHCTEPGTSRKGKVTPASRGRGLVTTADSCTPSKPPLSRPGEAHNQKFTFTEILASTHKYRNCIAFCTKQCVFTIAHACSCATAHLYMSSKGGVGFTQVCQAWQATPAC